MMMEDVSLVDTTGNMEIDAALYGFIGLFQMTFPGRVRAYYLLGTQATNEAVGASDVDVCIVFKDRLQEGERERFQQFLHFCQPVSRVPLDVSIKEEARLLADGEVNLKHSSLFLMGEDIRERIPQMPMEKWIRTSMHQPFMYIERSRPRADEEPLRYPLGFPDPSGDFYGYDYRHMRMPDGSLQPSIKELVTMACRMATALLALQKGEYTISKSSTIKAHREHLHDEWTPLFEAIYESRTRWGYLLPTEPADRAHVRELCARMVELENHFLGLYRDYLLAELRGGALPDRIRAATRLGEILYPGEEVRAALKQLENEEEPLRDAARESLARIEKYGKAASSAA
ncbi:nucleotidyltransferase domain-containing protein [Archangium violaceum]|uniref:nucleotidyltransferase domain-containing protein n=1 Tax=Archangium violaceum TaxID=83451 RepID=UPI00194F0A4B|nr:nucleotidyltransferase domain-containing protein [Archangium violaceum]QRO01040.1 nucleotidyltransferase domain-containing protein [Archangium violaceum]